MVKPVERKELAQQSVASKSISINLGCKIFVVSESCDRYQAKLRNENAEITNKLIDLTETDLT